jgi:phage terminase large subunit
VKIIASLISIIGNVFESSVVYLQNLNSKADICVNQGGTSSGKTYSILQALFSIAISQPRVTITVVGETIPNLKSGALRDALDIWQTSEELKLLVTNYNKSDRIFEFKSQSVIEFKSYMDSQSAKSGKRDYLFINEANGITMDIFNELHLRTRLRTFIDYNPNYSFWVHEHLIGKPNVELIISDHRHNPFLTDKIREKIEALKDIDIELWNVYARGRTGKIEGLIFRNWIRSFLFPKDAKLIGYALDFGFTNDPTAMIEVRMQDGELHIKELIYESGLTNHDISERMHALGINQYDDIVCDSAEPKSIEELRRLGWRVEGAKKGPDSIKNSIDILKRYKMNVIDSGNLVKELNSYKWKTDRSTGKAMNEPVDFMNHAIDSLRYIALNKLATSNRGVYNIV